MNNSIKAIIISASSDFGEAMTHRWLNSGWEIFGTYRTKSVKVNDLSKLGANLVFCDLSVPASIRAACSELRKACPKWDVLVLCPGTQEPIGPFIGDDFNKWEKSITINLINQLRIVHELLPLRNKGSRFGPCVMFFAGGGTNSAPTNYSAYILSKIGLIKMTELLDAEIRDSRFVIVGPGWVKTKIHKETLRAGIKAGNNYQLTKEKMAGDSCTPMEKVMDCCDWVIKSPRRVVGGRNFSVVSDLWGTKKIEKILKNNPDMYKLRRSGNDRLVKQKGEYR